MSRAIPLERFVGEARSAMAVARYCRCCKWVDTRMLVRGVGRGNGFREGNKQRGRALDHVKTCPAVAAALTKETP